MLAFHFYGFLCLFYCRIHMGSAWKCCRIMIFCHFLRTLAKIRPAVDTALVPGLTDVIAACYSGWEPKKQTTTITKAKIGLKPLWKQSRKPISSILTEFSRFEKASVMYLACVPSARTSWGATARCRHHPPPPLPSPLAVAIFPRRCHPAADHACRLRPWRGRRPATVDSCRPFLCISKCA